MTQLLTIVLGTFASEDLTCVAVGLLIAAGRADPATGLAGCFLGIVAGDAGLWLAGRAARRWPRLARRLPARGVETARRWLDRNVAVAVLTTRFLPGTRLPLYLGAGALGTNAGRFLGWTVVAALVWVPLVVLSVALFGDALAGPLRRWVGAGPALLGVAVVIVMLRFIPRWVNRRSRPSSSLPPCGGGPGWGVFGQALEGLPATLALPHQGGGDQRARAGRSLHREQLVAAVSRLWRWEFWPAWLFYAPLAPLVGWLCLRYRSVTVWTAANPGIPAGGVVGESKHAILARLPERWVIPSLLLPEVSVGDRLARLQQWMEERGFDYPLVLKPDAAQRGAGVRRVGDIVEAEKYLQRQPTSVLAQPYHPGPFEVGIFYYRVPGEATGRIFSITDKVFPVVVGDGRATLAELIWRHPRYRMQARTFLTRHAADADRVLADGERVSLALAGNHCQGTLFRDGARLITPALERTIDDMARSFPGFYVGRFDVRYADEAEFRAGRGLAVVELNGATAESTNVYDPAGSLLGAYRTLTRQWALLFRIGDRNRRRGHRPLTLAELLRLVRDYYRDRRVDPLAD